MVPCTLILIEAPAAARWWLLILALSAPLFTAGCTSLVPRHYTSNALANGVTEYHSPSFERRISVPGWALVCGTAGVGAWRGYASNIAVRWTGWERNAQVQPIGNAALGAFTGFALSYLATLITSGDPPPVTADDAEEWLDKVNDRLLLLPVDSLHPGRAIGTIRGIARNADAAFTIGSMEDARLFLWAFHESPHRDNVLAKAVRGLRRDSLFAFAQLVSGLPAERLAIQRYIEEIPTMNEVIAMAPHLRSYQDALEHRAALLTLTFADLKRFRHVFPESSLTDGIAVRLRDRLEHNEIPEFIRLFPDVDSRHDLKRRYLAMAATTAEAIDALHRFPEIRADADRRAAQLAGSAEEYRAYLGAFPDGQFAAEISRRLRAEIRAAQSRYDTDSIDGADNDDDQ